MRRSCSASARTRCIAPAAACSPCSAAAADHCKQCTPQCLVRPTSETWHSSYYQQLKHLKGRFDALSIAAFMVLIGRQQGSSMVQTGGQQSVFVTVGTTKFEALIKAVDTPDFAAALAAKGYTQLIIQKGAGKYVPCKLLPAGATSGKHESGISVQYFDFSPSLAAYISSAALVISHAGAGSIFETLHAGKPLIVVPNPLMMDNHQAELSDHLAAMQAVVSAAPEQLPSAVASLDISQLKPFPAKKACGIIDVIEDCIGRHRAAS